MNIARETDWALWMGEMKRVVDAIKPVMLKDTTGVCYTCRRKWDQCEGERERSYAEFWLCASCKAGENLKKYERNKSQAGV